MKQRLVGTLVLGSLALILIPLLLDGEGVERPPLTGSIPPAPVFDNTPLPEPVRPEILADSLASPADTTAVPEAVDAVSDLADASADATTSDLASNSTTEPATAGPAEEAAPPAPAAEPAASESVTAAPAEPAASISEPVLDNTGLPEGWAVRLGVFGERANADRLLSRLVADGYKAYVRPVGVSTAVLIGPVLTQNEAVALQAELNGLKAKYQIDNVIVQRYDISQ